MKLCKKYHGNLEKIQKFLDNDMNIICQQDDYLFVFKLNFRLIFLLVWSHSTQPNIRIKPVLSFVWQAVGPDGSNVYFNLLIKFIKGTGDIGQENTFNKYNSEKFWICICILEMYLNYSKYLEIYVCICEKFVKTSEQKLI